MAEVSLKRELEYQDFLPSSGFNITTVDGINNADFVMVSDTDSIISAIKNIFTYEEGDLFFADQIISANLKKHLFEPTDFLTELSLRNSIKEAIDMFEPRVKLVDIIITAEDNKYDIVLKLHVIRLKKELTTTITIKRVR